MRLASYLLSIVLMSNSLLLGLAGTAKFDALNSQLPQNVMAICTGSAVKYISEIEYFNNGTILEIVLPNQDTEHNTQSDTCPVNTGLEQSRFFEYYSISQLVFTLYYVAISAEFKQSASFSFAYFLLPSRAPPSLV